jgi:hypothetical protein
MTTASNVLIEQTVYLIVLLLSGWSWVHASVRERRRRLLHRPGVELACRVAGAAAVRDTAWPSAEYAVQAWKAGASVSCFGPSPFGSTE